MAIDKARESLVHVDNKGRVVLPKNVRRSELYAVEVMENNEIILRPRVAVDPREVITKKTLDILDESMHNLAKDKAGKPINLSEFANKDEPHGHKSKATQKHSCR